MQEAGDDEDFGGEEVGGLGAFDEARYGGWTGLEDRELGGEGVAFGICISRISLIYISRPQNI